jgi:hypothetical protein
MSISIAITPEAAIKAGARWRLVRDSGSAARWLDSGKVLNLQRPATYRIEFTPVVGWKQPQEVEFRNINGYTHYKTAAYQPLSAYELGQIPPQAAWHGQLLEFVLPPDQAAKLTVSSQPSPAGELKLNPKTGLFHYQPAPEDKFPFTVTLAQKDGKQQQTFEVTPMPILPAEVDIFHSRPVLQAAALPEGAAVRSPLALETELLSAEGGMPLSAAGLLDEQELQLPSSFLAIHPVSEAGVPEPMTTEASTMLPEPPKIDRVKNPAEFFNLQERETYNLRLSGENVVFEKGSWPYDSLHEAQDIKRLGIYAETVTIRSPLHLPQTSVSIYARELSFEDPPEAGAAVYLSTTPVGYDTAADAARRDPQTNAVTPAEDGKPGARAGDVSLYLEYYTAPSNPSIKRFILTGGRGQDPGGGLDGRDGSKMPGFEKFQHAKAPQDHMIVYGIRHNKSSDFDSSTTVNQGKQEWPTDGEDATPAGTPGQGGGGGTFTATLNLATQVDLTGGDCGAKGTVYSGGAPGEPRMSVMTESWHKWRTWKGWYDHWQFNDWAGSNFTGEAYKKKFWAKHTVAGKDALPPNGKRGQRGQVSQAGHPLSWLHPLLLSDMLERVKDSYLGGDLESAQVKLAEYAELLEVYRSLEAWNELDTSTRLELGRMRDEIAGLLARLAGHLDYFGNPAGWVPMLSFEVNRTIFDNEIDRAMEVLYLAYWLQEKAQDDAQRVQVLEQLQSQLKQEIKDLKDQFAEAAEGLPGLDAEAGRIANQINLLQQKLKMLEDELRRKAEKQLEEPWWKTGLKLAATVCSVLPVGQPALGAVGGAMNLAADYDKDDPWKTILGAADVVKVYGEGVAGKMKEGAKLLAAEVDPTSAAFVAEKSAEAIQGWTGALSDGMHGVYKVMSERQAPKSEVDALLQKLEAESPEFKQLSGDISDLLESKMDFAQKLSDAIQLISGIPNTISADLLAIDSAGRAADRGTDVLHDGRLAMHLEGMERRARERLLKYHYYLAKSYEYRLLRPYRGGLDIDQIFEKMQELAELNIDSEKPYQLSKEQFESLKAVYHEVLSSIAEEIFTAYNQNQPELSAPRHFNLNKDEIQRLNAGLPVSINLMDLELFSIREENVRLVDVEIESLKVTTKGGGQRRLAELDLRFEHSGISQLRQAGRTIRFCHAAQGSTNPIAWGARYDATDQKITPIKPSAASDSLLRSLLKSDTAGSIMLYSRPAAWADLSASREVKADPGTEITLKELRLNVSYDFTRKSSGINVLHVKPLPESENLQPYIKLDREDLNKRKDGRGSFFRAYQGLPAAIQLEAQASYGRWKFDFWTDQAGKVLSKSPVLKVNLDKDQELRAVYTLVKRIFT